MTLAQKTIQIALGQADKKVREVTRNRGPEVDRYMKEGGGLDPAGRYPWCAAFVSWCILEAAKALQVVPTFKRGASVQKLWDRNPTLRLKKPEPGCIWLRLNPDQTGHVGLVVSVKDDVITTVEGNTGAGADIPAKDREGDGVYCRTRKVSEANLGFLRIG